MSSAPAPSAHGTAPPATRSDPASRIRSVNAVDKEPARTPTNGHSPAAGPASAIRTRNRPKATPAASDSTKTRAEGLILELVGDTDTSQMATTAMPAPTSGRAPGGRSEIRPTTSGVDAAVTPVMGATTLIKPAARAR